MSTSIILPKVTALVAMLKEHGVEHVTKEHTLTAKYHKVYPNLVQLSYNQVESDLSNPIPQVCRGIILDKDNDFKVVALPYTKFFNYGEHLADTIDWSTAKVYEKLDGSIITLYWHLDNWHVATSGLPDASGRAVGFAKLHGGKDARTEESPPVISTEFWRIWNEKGYQFPTDNTKCYMFELLLTKYRNVVYSEHDRIVLHGVRDLGSFAESDPVVVATAHNWEVAKIIPANSLEEVLEASKKLNPHEMEGFVVADSQYRRVKIKSPQYVALHLLSGPDTNGQNQMRMLEIARANEGSEFIAYFPHLNTVFQEVKDKYTKMCKDLQATADELAKITDGKALAKEAQKTPFPWLYFETSKTKKSVVDIFSKMELKRLAKILAEFEGNPKTKLKLYNK